MSLKHPLSGIPRELSSDIDFFSLTCVLRLHSCQKPYAENTLLHPDSLRAFSLISSHRNRYFSSLTVPCSTLFTRGCSCSICEKMQLQSKVQLTQAAQTTDDWERGKEGRKVRGEASTSAPSLVSAFQHRPTQRQDDCKAGR